MGATICHIAHPPRLWYDTEVKQETIPMRSRPGLFRFLYEQTHAAYFDPFAPQISWLGAFWWVVCNFRWLREEDDKNF